MDSAEITEGRKKGSGGRPADTFAQANVDKLKGTRVRCKHCQKEFAGSAKRIRVHLSGKGSGISYCPNVSTKTREEALMNKSDNISRQVEDAMRPTPQKLLGRGGGSEEHVTDALLKFMMSTNEIDLSNPSKFLECPLFRTFLERAHEYGVPSSLLEGDSAALAPSALRIKHEVEHHMLTLTRSWNTTGCTFMPMNLFSVFEKDVIVIAVYSPNGVFFVEQLDSGLLDESLKRHSPRLYIDKGVQWLLHGVQEGGEIKCELSDTDRWGISSSREVHYCLRDEVQALYNSKSCYSSDWARSLIDIAMKIHDYLYLHDKYWYFILFITEYSRPSVFLSVIKHYHKSRLPDERNRLIESDIEDITNGSNFWSDGWKLRLILMCVKKIGDVMDTTAPAAGYLGMAIDKVSHVLETYGLQLGGEALQFWEEVKLYLHNGPKSSRLAASFLNPVYFLQHLGKDPLLSNKLKTALQDFAGLQGGELEEIDKEVEGYIHIFKCLSQNISLESRHPVKLWEEYGRHLSTLYKCATTLLNRPLNCMGKQLKEHLYYLKGSDDYITRMNLKMMRHFEDLGDDIYKPLDLSELNLDKFSKSIPWQVLMRG